MIKTENESCQGVLVLKQLMIRMWTIILGERLSSIFPMYLIHDYRMRLRNGLIRIGLLLGEVAMGNATRHKKDHKNHYSMHSRSIIPLPVDAIE